MVDHERCLLFARPAAHPLFRLARRCAELALAVTALASTATVASAQIGPGSGSGSGTDIGTEDGSGDDGSGSGSGGDEYSYCGDGWVSGSETCDAGWENGLAGSCNETCSGFIARTPFADPDSAPVLQAMTYGRVVGTRQYEAVLHLGDLPGVGLAPGYQLSIRLRSNSPAGACGPACAVLACTVTAAAGGYVLSEGGVQRRFEASGTSWREVAPQPGMAFRPATAALSGTNLVVSEPGGQLTRTFNASGREIARTTPWGAVTLTYDSSGRFIRATNAAGAMLTATYDGSGRISTVTDPTGFAMTVQYAWDGHAISLEGPADGFMTPSIAIGWYNDEITSVARVGFAPVEITYDRGAVSFVRDVDGTGYAFDSTPTRIVVVDSALQYRRMTFDGQHLAMVETNRGAQVTYVRDTLRRVTSTRHATATGALVESVVYDASGNITSATDVDGRVTQMTYDSQGNLTARTDPAGRTTRFSYAQNRLASMTDPVGRVTSWTRDANGLVTSTTALGLTSSATYTSRGLVATATDADGVVTTFGYDAAGRLTSRSRPGEPTVTFARTAVAGGEQIVVTRGGESWTVVQDRYRRVTSETSSRGAAATYTYDPVTGLRDSTTETFRGQTQTTQRTFTNTGDDAQVWINGQQRQSAPRTVPPGDVWLQPGSLQ